jgi:hypothetical protein
MKVLSHRGYWKTPSEKNSPEAFRRSFGMGFGTELDLRDLAGEVVVSHDPPAAGALTAEDMLAIHAEHGRSLTLALNVKADGLQGPVAALLRRFEVRDAFVFDMSVPDALHWLRAGVPLFTRHSDVEQSPVLYEEAAGVWLDGFRSDWWGADVVRRHLLAGKRVCIVSPELHGRAHAHVWRMLADADLQGWGDRVMLCTDHPEEARGVFSRGH